MISIALKLSTNTREFMPQTILFVQVTLTANRSDVDTIFQLHPVVQV